MEDGTAKPIPTLPPDGGVDRGVHPDYPAPGVEQRPARVPAVDRSIDLQEVSVARRADIAPSGGEDPGRHRASEAERVADRHHPVPDARIAVVTEGEPRARAHAFDLEHGEVGPGIPSNHTRLVAGSVVQGDGDLRRVGDDMVARHDVSLGVDEESRAHVHPGVRAGGHALEEALETDPSRTTGDAASRRRWKTVSPR